MYIVYIITKINFNWFFGNSPYFCYFPLSKFSCIFRYNCYKLSVTVHHMIQSQLHTLSFEVKYSEIRVNEKEQL